MNTVEERIISLMRQKDRSALTLLYDHYSDALYGIVLRIVRNKEQARDVMQESYVKVWRNMDKYDPSKAKLFTWLLRIFRNSAIDQLRKNKTHSTEEIQNATSFVGIPNHLEIQPDFVDVSKHLAGLDEKFRLVIEKVYMQGMTQNEASEALHLPLGTVKSRIRLGLKALRKIYIPIIIFLLIV